MNEQGVLPILDRVRRSLESSSKDIRGELRRIAKSTKQGAVLARAAELDDGNFSKALKGERHLDVGSLPAFFWQDEERGLIRLLCRLCGGKFVPDPQYTFEQRYENLAHACRLNGAAGAAILKQAGEEP